MVSKNQDRSSNFELLRIISILLIIGYHLYEHSGNGNLLFISFSLNKVFLMFLGSWGIVGVHCFVILSAWFLVDNKPFRLERAVSVIIQTTFYACMLYVATQLFQGQNVSAKEIIKAIIVVPYNQYWFITAYVAMLFFSPIINYAIHRMTNELLKKTVILLFPVLVAWKFILWISPMSNVGLFIYIYFLTAYMKRMEKKAWIYQHRRMIFYFGIIFVMMFGIGISLLPDSIRTSGTVKFLYKTLLAKNSPIMLMIAFSAFYFVYDLNFHSKAVNEISRHTLSVYLIHENEFVWPLLWGGVFVAENYFFEPWFAPFLILVIIAVFTICIFIDSIVCHIYGYQIKKLMHFLKSPISKIDAWINEIK